MSALILPIAIFGVVASLIVILAVLLLPARENQRARQLRDVVASYQRNPASPAAPSSALVSLRERSSAQAAHVMQQRGWYDRIAGSLSNAGIAMKPEEFALLTVGAGVVGSVIMFVLTASIVTAALGLVIGVTIPILTVRVKTGKRHRRFLAELPDTLTAIASALSAGAALSQAVESVSHEAQGPMHDELNRAIVNARLGTPIPDSLEESAARMRCQDLQLVVMAIRLQSMHGGNLSELLNTVAATLRERVQMKRHVSALSAEGRLSIYVLIALPICSLIMISVTRPEYFSFFVSTLPGLIMLTIGAVLLGLGYLWARSIATVEV